MSETAERQLLVTVDPSIGYRALDRVPGVVTVEPAAPEPAAAMAESRKMRDVVCKLLDLFGQPDGRRMRHASITAATLGRYAAEAGVKP